ncbi:hypothetical protein [Bacillus sp. EB01]|uniref:hypothetical protein n=1 Tax=Bacillus sp. EB01 TaxID=1347086 RepID=UPI0005C65978|nr:hypothetical protein [Bacillus sp. EB01]
MAEKKEELKQQLSVLTARRDRIQKNLYDVEKEINELNKKISKLKDCPFNRARLSGPVNFFRMNCIPISRKINSLATTPDLSFNPSVMNILIGRFPHNT